ncbi:DUF1127 domain-containing protein [Pseudosulfitobacter sp. SM2401]|uniref:DUF1127 domain-containing protein n=1 Tax=Pseudosulfitobacter sp. SM2401 TaxID=3350098 RepID=UPI0036F3E6D9
MTFNTQPEETGSSYAITCLISLLATFGAKANAALRTLQVARMMSTLSSMSDIQLAQIGISRSDIPEYAETLMAKE